MDFLESGTICSPLGYQAAGVAAGIKKSGKLDLALLTCDVPANFAVAFTANAFASPSVVHGRELVAKGGKLRAVIVNSGCANACTGRQGMSNVNRIARELAERLEIAPDEVFVSSTGIIGEQLPMERLLNGAWQAVEGLSREGGDAAAEAIMTTDTVPKSCAVRLAIDGQPVTIGGMTKGAGMIAPRLRAEPARGLHATMLAYVTTDAALEPGVLRCCLADSLDNSFNRINIDGDCSTNDTFLALANGEAGNVPIRQGTFEAEQFQRAFNRVAGELARQMVLDGEGVTRFVEVNVTGARNVAEARQCADTISRSLLCKTAWFGGDPNWGRVICAAGYAGVQVNPELVRLDYDKVPIVVNGVAAGSTEAEQRAVLEQREFRLSLDLGVGEGEYTMWTNDLSYEYVRINAEYHT